MQSPCALLWSNMRRGYSQLMLITCKADIAVAAYLPFIAECLASGVTSIQLREKQLIGEELISFAIALQELTHHFSIPLIINDHIDVALHIEADGVHLGQDDCDVMTARRLLGPDKIIGLSVDNIEQVAAADVLPVNYLGVGAIFDTNSKTDVKRVWGCDGLLEARRMTSKDIIALGGINENNVSNVMKSGADGIAAISAFHDADDVSKTISEMLINISAIREHRI